MENHEETDECQNTCTDIKVQKRKQEIKDLMGDKIEELCENIIKIHEAHNKRDYVEGNHKLSFDASLKMEAAIHKEPMIHYYAKDILDEHNLPIFSSDKAYSVKDVQDKGYCCYSGSIPCPEGAEAFFVDCHGNPKQRFLC